MATTPPCVTPDATNDWSAEAAQGTPAGSAVGQTAGRPTYGSGGYELNPNTEDGAERGSGSASSSQEKTSRPAVNDDE